jgi:hypothetical protein
MADRAILLLDDAVSAKQMTMSQPQRLSKFLESHKAIALTTASRSWTERIFSVGPSFLLSQMPTLSPEEWLVYADADLYFFRPLEEYLAAFDDANVILAPHRHFAWNKKRLAKYGEFNVGLVAFRNNKEGLAALQYWADSCLEWCSDVPEDGKYADQKYLENFSKVANGVVIDDRKGVNLAPWNLGFSKLTLDEDDKLMVDGEPVYYFHAQGIKRTKSAWILGHLPYFSLASRSAKKLIYRPYLAGLLKWEEENSVAKSSSSRASTGFAALAVAIFGKTLQFLLGQVIFDSQLRRLTSDPNKRPN